MTITKAMDSVSQSTKARDLCLYKEMKASESQSNPRSSMTLEHIHNNKRLYPQLSEKDLSFFNSETYSCPKDSK